MKPNYVSGATRHPGNGNAARHMLPFCPGLYKTALNTLVEPEKKRVYADRSGPLLLTAMEMHRLGEGWVTLNELSTRLGIDTTTLNSILSYAVSRGELVSRKVCRRMQYSMHGKVATYESPFDVLERK